MDSVRHQGLDQHHNNVWVYLFGNLMGNTGNEFLRDLSGYMFFNGDIQPNDSKLFIGLVVGTLCRKLKLSPDAP